MTVVTESTNQDGLDEAILEVEEQLSTVFGRARATLKDAAVQIHPELQPVGYKILGAIVRLGETNAHVLADLLDTDKSVLSRQLRVLEERGFVVSRADARDGRARVLSATPEAIERVQSVRAQQRNQLRDALRSRPESEVRAFASMLRLLNET